MVVTSTVVIFPSLLPCGKHDAVVRRFIGIPYDQSDVPLM